MVHSIKQEIASLCSPSAPRGAEADDGGMKPPRLE